LASLKRNDLGNRGLLEVFGMVTGPEIQRLGQNYQDGF
jgi:hypothetical protein